MGNGRTKAGVAIYRNYITFDDSTKNVGTYDINESEVH